jgi:hypothetical protein
MYSAATVNQFKPAGRPRQFLLQLVSNLTSILTVFFINLIKNKDYGKSQIFCYVLINFLFFPVYGIINKRTKVSNLVTEPYSSTDKTATS